MSDIKPSLPTDSAERKAVPLARGLLDYFPAALAEVARLSKAGNDKHNPGQEMHHARGKSTDHADCILRHLADRGTVDPDDGIRHSVKVAWRALALLQEELEAAGEAPLARAARLPEAKPIAVRRAFVASEYIPAGVVVAVADPLVETPVGPAMAPEPPAPPRSRAGRTTDQAYEALKAARQAVGLTPTPPPPSPFCHGGPFCACFRHGGQ